MPLQTEHKIAAKLDSWFGMPWPFLKWCALLNVSQGVSIECLTTKTITILFTEAFFLWNCTSFINDLYHTLLPSLWIMSDECWSSVLHTTTDSIESRPKRLLIKYRLVILFVAYIGLVQMYFEYLPVLFYWLIVVVIFEEISWNWQTGGAHGEVLVWYGGRCSEFDFSLLFCFPLVCGLSVPLARSLTHSLCSFFLPIFAHSFLFLSRL